MAVGKQTEATIVHWHPGESTGFDGYGNSGAAIPTDIQGEDDITASGLRTFLDTRIDGEVTARTAVNTRVSTLSTRLVASGTLPVGV